MTEQDVQATLRAQVAIVTNDLSDADLAALNIAAQLDYEPRNRPWYAQVKSLFTEQDGTRMHAETKRALAAVVLRRIGKGRQ